MFKVRPSALTTLTTSSITHTPHSPSSYAFAYAPFYFFTSLFDISCSDAFYHSFDASFVQTLALIGVQNRP